MSFKSYPALLAFVVATLPLASQAQKVMPVLVSTKYTLTMGNMSFQATAKNSGRIQSVKHSGTEVLHQDTGSATSYGSTFWPSPQAVWNWPPPAAIDANAFTASIDPDSTISFYNSGAVDATTKIRVHKTYWANIADSSFNMRYTMINTGTARPWAPWEDTRIDTGGIYLFPKGTDAITGAIGTYTSVDTGGIVWYQHNNNNLPGSGTNKFYADGSKGWYAHVYANRLLLIKKFKDAPASKKAPSPEDEIEFYSTNKPLNATSFIEMEAQGAYDTIKTNDSVSWDMKWLVRKLPDNVSVTLNNPQIVSYINQVLAGSTTALTQQSKAAGFEMKYSTREVTLDLREASSLSLSVVNIQGREIARLHSGKLSAGSHIFPLNQSGFPNGVNWLVIQDSKHRIVSQQMLVRLKN